MTYRLFLFFLLGLFSAELAAQSGLEGSVKNTKGEALPFAAVSVRGAAIGTIANEEGRYRLELKPGTYEILFQYLGYQTGMKTVEIAGQTVPFDAVLAEQALNLNEVKVGSRNEDPAYTIMRRAIAKSRYHLLQVSSYKAKVYTKSSIVITDLPLEFLYRKELEKISKEENFRKGVPILNETVSEVEFSQPNNYKQKVVAARNSQDNTFANPDEYLLTSFYKPEVVKTVSPLSPRAFAYYKFEYLGSFRENGVEVNKIKVIPRAYGEGVFRGTIHIIEDLWCLYSLELQTAKQGINLEVKQLYAPVRNVWMPVNQQVHFNGGIYGLKGKGDYVISQSFTTLQVNPAFQPNIVVLDGKRDKTEADEVKLSKKEMRTKELEALLQEQKKISAKNLRKLLKTYDRQQFEKAKAQGEDVDMVEKRVQSTEVDSLATTRSRAYWDSIRTVPLTQAELTSYGRLDSLVRIRKPQADLVKPNTDTSGVNNGAAESGKKRHKNSFGLGNVFTGATFSLSSDKTWKLHYKSPAMGLQVNTVEGIVLNGGGFSVQHQVGGSPDKPGRGHDLTLSALTRYAFGRNKLLPLGEIRYKSGKNTFSLEGGRGISQFNAENPISYLLNSLTTLFFEQNFAKIYQKDFLKLQYNYAGDNAHFRLYASLEYEERKALANAEKAGRYRLIDWRRRDFTSNIPDHRAFGEDESGNRRPMPDHTAITAALTASWKPWQKYRMSKGRTIYYKDDSPEFALTYRKGISGVLNSRTDFDFLKLRLSHGVQTGVRSRLFYQVAAGSFLNRKQVQFPDFNHFSGNRFFFQFGDPVGTFRMLDYYRYSTDKEFMEAHVLSEFRQLLLTQLPLFRIFGIKETLMVHYLAAPGSDNYTELGYGFDVGIRFPLRLEVITNFEGLRYQGIAFRVGTTMNVPF